MTLMCLSGIFCSTLSHLMPSIQPVMRYIGAAYILYLAWKTFHRLPPKEQDVKSRPSYLSGLLLQLLNIKIIIYGLTMFSSFILPYETRIPFLFLYAVYLMLLGAMGNLIWALAGNVLRGFYDSHYRLMNLMMSVLLVWCALRIVLSALPVS